LKGIDTLALKYWITYSLSFQYFSMLYPWISSWWQTQDLSHQCFYNLWILSIHSYDHYPSEYHYIHFGLKCSFECLVPKKAHPSKCTHKSACSYECEELFFRYTPSVRHCFSFVYPSYEEGNDVDEEKVSSEHRAASSRVNK